MRVFTPLSPEVGLVFSYLFPARGRKRSPSVLAVVLPPRQSFPIFSPQGDGNSPRPGIRSPGRPVVFSYLFPARGRKLSNPAPSQSAEDQSFPIFSPQGDGNAGRYRDWDRGNLCLSRLFLSFPRKGTETERHRAVSNQSYKHRVFSYLFPARGRKRC